MTEVPVRFIAGTPGPAILENGSHEQKYLGLQEPRISTRTSSLYFKPSSSQSPSPHPSTSNKYAPSHQDEHD
jgi:hypothetical protein